MELLLIYRPRRDGRLSWPSWLTHSGRLTHKVVTGQPWIRRRSGKVRQLQTDVLTTEPRRQPRISGLIVSCFLVLFIKQMCSLFDYFIYYKTVHVVHIKFKFKKVDMKIK